MRNPELNFEREKDCPCGHFPNGDCDACKGPEAAELRRQATLSEQYQNPQRPRPETPKKDLKITDYIPYQKLKKKLENEQEKTAQ